MPSDVIVHAYRENPGELEVIVEDDPVEGVIVLYAITAVACTRAPTAPVWVWDCR